MNPSGSRSFVVQALACLPWLLVCAVSAADWHELQGGRWRELPIQLSGKPGFRAIAPASSGVRFTNICNLDRHLTNQIFLNGSGVAAGDVDGDGRCDLYFSGIDSPNALYRNLGDWKFEDITQIAGVPCSELDATGVAFADLDGDSDFDLIVNSVAGGTHIFLNDGKAKFTRLGPVLNPKLGGMSLALADIEGDGDLDLYVANYRTITLRDQPNTRFNIKVIDGKPRVAAIDGRPITDPELAHRFDFHITMGEGRGTFRHEENGEPDALYRNEGGGRFSYVPFTNGVFKTEDGKNLALPPFDWGLSVVFRDINGDGAPDIYICNDFRSPDRIWINDGRGNFRGIAPLALRQISYSSMGVDFADINRDGLDDFIVVDMLSRIHYHRFTQRTDLDPDTTRGEITNRIQTARNTLFLNRGDGTYAEIAQLSGLEATEWSWTPIFLDVDLDGYEDLLVSNGFERDGMNMDTLREVERLKKQRSLSAIEQLRLRKMFPRLATSNLAFRNLGNLKFEDKTAEWEFNEPAVSQGMALADLDNDGDLDVAVNNFNGAASLYRNEASGPRVAVKLKGAAPNTSGIGAKIKIIGGPVSQTQEMICGGRYLSSDESIRTFAAGTGGMTIEVTWRSGRQTVVKGARANRLYEIDENGAVPFSTTQVTRSKPLFSLASLSPAHRHVDEPFNDFANQPLLSHRLSQLGPGVSWIDVNNDGFDDLLIASGRGGTLSLYMNDTTGGFKKSDAPPLTEAVARDQSTVLSWRKPTGELALLAGSADYERDFAATDGCVRIYDLSEKSTSGGFPGLRSGTGPLTMADIDTDGDLDLFVGGRVTPDRYPEPAASRLYRNQGASFELAMQWPELALVSGAVFSDFDADGDPDLILACHWAPLRVFRNTKGQFTEATSDLKLDSYTGWWNGVTTGDFDGDGRLDIVASNWGENTRYQAFRGKPLQIFYGDIDGNGTIEIVESYADRRAPELRPLQPFHLIGAVLPLLRERVPTFDQYAKSTLPQIYRDEFKSLKGVSVQHLESMVFFNRGDHFDAKPLPIEAQFSPAFATCVADFDGDGNEDLFLSQNFFATHPEISRYDAGRGLLLKGNGHGGFDAVSGQESGIVLYGEQRGAAVSDYDHDGRADLVVTQNGAETMLFRNVHARPGLRVHLRGPEENPDAIGTTIRVGTPERFGPARELHAGSGYWSHDSTVQVMSSAEPATQIVVRWPGGKTTTSKVPQGAREVILDSTGALRAAGK